MTTPGGVPNLPPGALTLDTLAAQLQDMTVPAMRGRAAQRLPSIFDTSTGGNALSDLSPFGVLTQLWAGFNSTVANADPADINGPEDLPGLLIDFIESLPLVGEFVGLLSAIQGTYSGDDPTLQQISNFFSLLRQFLGGLDFFDPDFDLGDAVQAFISQVLAPSGLLLTEWNLTGNFGGLQLPFDLPGSLGAAGPDTVLQRFVSNLLGFLHADFTDTGFNLVDAVTDWVQSILFPTGKVLTEWNLFPPVGGAGGMGFPHSFPATFAPGDGLSLPFELPGQLGSPTPLSAPLQLFVDNLRLFLRADYLDPDFNIGAALTEFINSQLLPSGLFAGFADIQAVIDAVSGGVAATITDIVTRLQHLASGSGQFDAAQLFNILGIPALDDASVPGLAAIKDAVWQAITSLTGSNITIAQLVTALQNIPFLNILGVGGPPDIGTSLMETWNQFVGGLVGTIGSGASLADLFNVAQDISSRATLGLFSFDILGIRNNKSLNTGFLPTSESNFAFDKVGLGSVAPTFALNQSTAITAYQRISEAADKGAVAWLGSGVNLITDAFVNVFKMDTTTGLSTLVHASPNIVGLMSSAMQHNIYELDTPLHVLPGEVYGIEIAVRGSGTHNIVGQQTWLPDHPTVFPRRMSAVRNSGTSAPPATITHSSLVYSGNVPFVEFAVTSGDPGVPHSPQTQVFGSPGTRTIPFPLWANTAELILAGSGGGGRQGGVFNFYGEGGHSGSWATATWIRGSDFTGTPTITITITPGGAGGSSGLGYGSAGGTTTVSIPGRTVIALGGAGGTSLDFGSENMSGRSPGNITYGGIVYVGGVQQNSSGSDGAPSGGGGSGGSDLLYQFGGAGAPGGVWLRFKSD